MVIAKRVRGSLSCSLACTLPGCKALGCGLGRDIGKRPPCSIDALMPDELKKEVKIGGFTIPEVTRGGTGFFRATSFELFAVGGFFACSLFGLWLIWHPVAHLSNLQRPTPSVLLLSLIGTGTAVGIMSHFYWENLESKQTSGKQPRA